MTNSLYCSACIRTYVKLVLVLVLGCCTHCNNLPFATIGALREHLSGKGLKTRMITNGGMYHAGNLPIGLFVENGHVRRALDTASEGKGNFYLDPNGVFFIDGAGAHILTTTEFAKKYPRAMHADASDNDGGLERAIRMQTRPLSMTLHCCSNTISNANKLSTSMAQSQRCTNQRCVPQTLMAISAC